MPALDVGTIKSEMCGNQELLNPPTVGRRAALGVLQIKME